MTDDNVIDRNAFFNVIKAIDSANKKELSALARVEKAIVSTITKQGIDPRVGVAKPAQSGGDFQPSKRRPGSRGKRSQAAGTDKVTAGGNKAAKPTNKKQSQVAEVKAGPGEKKSVTTRATTDSKVTVSVVPPAAKDNQFPAEFPAVIPQEQDKAATRATTDSKVTASVAPSEAKDNQFPAELPAVIPQEQDKAAAKAQKKTNELLEGLYEDSQGRLRQENGAFASRKQKEAYTKTQQQDSEQSDSILKTLSNWAAGKAAVAASDNEAADGAGVAVGSSFWLAGKEVAQKITGAKEFIEDNGLNSKEGIKSKVDNAKAAVKNPFGSVKSFFGRGDTQTSSSVDRTISAAAPVTGGLSRAAVERESHSAGGELAAVTDEQTATLEAQNKEQIDLLEKIERSLGNAGGGGGLFGDDLNFNRKKKRGSGKRRSGKRIKSKGRFGRMKSVLSTGGEYATNAVRKTKGGGLLTKAAGLGSKALGSAGMLARGAGKAIPLLAPALAAYDAFSGFTDDEKQKEVFNLKEGQQATTGQKSSMAMANLLDMGGLVSGGAGLLGSLMGGLGFKGAQEALTFDTDSITKGIYSAFAGESDAAAQDKPVAKPAVTTSSPYDYRSRKNTDASTAAISARYAAPAPKAASASKQADEKDPVNVFAQTDPALTKALEELLKVTKENGRGDKGVTNINRSVTNVSAQNKGGTAGIPIGPSDTQLQLIAMDAN